MRSEPRATIGSEKPCTSTAAVYVAEGERAPWQRNVERARLAGLQRLDGWRLHEAVGIVPAPPRHGQRNVMDGDVARVHELEVERPWGGRAEPLAPRAALHLGAGDRDATGRAELRAGDRYGRDALHSDRRRCRHVRRFVRDLHDARAWSGWQTDRQRRGERSALPRACNRLMAHVAINGPVEATVTAELGHKGRTGRPTDAGHQKHFASGRPRAVQCDGRVLGLGRGSRAGARRGRAAAMPTPAAANAQRLIPAWAPSRPLEAVQLPSLLEGCGADAKKRTRPRGGAATRRRSEAMGTPRRPSSARPRRPRHAPRGGP